MRKKLLQLSSWLIMTSACFAQIATTNKNKSKSPIEPKTTSSTKSNSVSAIQKNKTAIAQTVKPIEEKQSPKNTIKLADKNGFKKGDKLLNVGIGANTDYSKGIPFGASFEKGISDVVSVGGNFDYLNAAYQLGKDYKFSVFYLGARASYHFNEILKLTNDKFDFYDGGTLGYRLFKWKDELISSSLGNNYGSRVFLWIYIGGKYYLTKHISVC